MSHKQTEQDNIHNVFCLLHDVFAPPKKPTLRQRIALFFAKRKALKIEKQAAYLHRAMKCGHRKPEKTTASAIRKFDDYTSERMYF